KTNVMRLLDANKISYNPFFFKVEVAPTGSEMADILGVPHKSTFKTLVTKSAKNINYVFMIPVDEELDLKKCAKAVNEKSIEMIKSKDLLGLTGYVHGGCSPIGMKKPFKTVIDESVLEFSKIVFSAGKIGYMVEVSPFDLKKIVNYITYDIKV
ncbi:MAG: Cys-tRNA(Pro) deacylase, partial [Firmicutes bacterium]|nr:Cys-tRNA(Pro) deacylase [Candidatus Caballimonas caccae]